MNPTNTQEFLRENSVFWSKLGFAYNPPRMDENGDPIIFFDNFDHFAGHHRNFTKSGVKIQSSILFSGWVGVGRYDYKLTDKILDAMFKDNPDIYYIPRIKLDAPLDWGKENPEEMCVYYEGPRDAESIRELVNTPKHDILGYETPKGYYTAGGWEDDRPNVGGVISNQSFSSKKWLDDAGEALRRIIDHLENGPYGDRILAYHIAYGVSGETCLWGRFGAKRKFGDYGISNHKTFFEWGMNKYQNLDTLRQAWNQTELNENNIELPTPSQREREVDNLESYFRATPEDKICVDYDMFMSDVNADAIEHFGKIVKAKTGKAVGCFYGYIFEVFNSAYTGWLGIDRILNSPNVDFIAAPKAYYRCKPGDPGGVMIPTRSVNRKKIWMDELDNRTHLCVTAEKQCENFQETQTVMWREFSKNTVHNSGFWWMDLGGGWYDSPEVLQEVAKIENVSKKVREKRGESVSEILLVIDEKSICHTKTSVGTHKMFMQEFVREATLCGSPIDLLLLSDLEEVDISQYKLIVFLNAFKLEPETWSKINARISKETSITWFYAPGILNPEFSLENVKATTGFDLVESQKGNLEQKIIPADSGFLANCGPMIFEDDQVRDIPFVELKKQDDLTVLGHYENGGIAAASKLDVQGRLNVYFSLPLLRTEHFRALVEEAGCHCYVPANCTVYADNRMIGVFPKYKVSDALSLKKPSDLLDLRTGEEWNNVSSIPLNMEPKTAKVFNFKN